MPRIELRDGYNGYVYRLDTPDPAKIGPWLAELLAGGLVQSTLACPAQVTMLPLSGESLHMPVTRILTEDGRIALINDLAAVLGLEIRGYVNARQPEPG